MGDVAMTVPVIASFLQQYPNVHITMLSHPRLKTIFPIADNFTFVAVDTKKEFAGNFGMVKLFRKLRKEKKYDAMIDLHDVLRSKLLRSLYKITGTPIYTIDKGRKEKKELTQEEKKVMIPLKSSIQRYAEVFEKAGYPIRLENPAPYKINASERISEELNTLLQSTKQTIGIAPFAQHKGKIYPLNKMEKVVAQLSGRENTQIFLFGGGEAEKKQLEEWSQKYPNTLSLAGKFSLNEELSLLQHCRVVITMDSANMHLASLVGTPVVSIWGATHPYAGFYGYQQKEENAVQVDLPCRPCSIYGNKPCTKGDYPCLNGISEEEIVKRVESVLGL